MKTLKIENGKAIVEFINSHFNEPAKLDNLSCLVRVELTYASYQMLADYTRTNETYYIATESDGGVDNVYKYNNYHEARYMMNRFAL